MKSIPTPCFILDENLLVENLHIIEKVQKEAGIDIILAFKGFAMWHAFTTIKKYVSAATSSSLHEVRLCYEEFGTKAHTYCVAYRPEEFEEIVSMSSYITFNSLAQYHTFIDQVPAKVKVGLRINPEWSDVETELYNPSAAGSRLGIPLSALGNLPDRVSGLHCHVLCESPASSTQHLLSVIEDKFADYLNQLEWLNLGGGHLMTRKGYDTSLLVNALRSFKQRHAINLMLEPGSAFAWQTGVLETSVIDLVDNNGIQTAIIDASFTCHMPDCLEMPYRPEIVQGHEKKKEGGYPYKLGGLSCLAGDYLDEYWFDQPLKIGDRITFLDMMHYTMVKTNMFNGIHHPSIAVKSNGQLRVLKSFDYADFRNRLG